jgi:hypothetical protein
MARYGYGMSVSGSRTAVVASSGVPAITTSKAFNSSGVQVGDTITGSIPGYWVQNQTTVTSVIFANDNSVTSIGSYAFQSCTSLASITIPSGVTNIGNYAFSSCTSLTSITMPNSVTSIGDYAFSSCTSLTSITTPSSVTSIGTKAFQNCSSLTSFTFSPTSSVTSIGEYAFKGCSNLTSITIPSSLTSIGNYAFGGFGLTSITIPNTVTSIGDYEFSNCTSLATVLCYVEQSAFVGSDAFYVTASPLTIRARSTDASWTAGTGLTFQSNTNVTVIKNL